MGDFEKTLHEVEIYFPKQIGPNAEGKEFFVKIDGVQIAPTCGVKVESAMLNNSVYPIVTISYYAKSVKGYIEGEVKEADHA